MIMKQMTMLAISCLGMALLASGQRPSSAGQTIPMAYELYSWQQSNGGWNFCVLTSPSGPNISAEQVFNKKFLLNGVKDLKRKISSLPVGATVLWLDRIMGTDPKTKGSGEGLSFPPSEIIQDIRHYAETRKIKVEMLSGQQGQ